MTHITMKAWIYRDAQTRAQKYNWTLVWDATCINRESGRLLYDTNIADIDGTSWGKNYEQAYTLYGEIARETEKAVLLECDYWNLNRAGRYVTDAPRCKGFKVWIPKSAIYAVDGVVDYSKVEIVEEA